MRDLDDRCVNPVRVEPYETVMPLSEDSADEDWDAWIQDEQGRWPAQVRNGSDYESGDDVHTPAESSGGRSLPQSPSPVEPMAVEPEPTTEPGAAAESEVATEPERTA